MLLKVKKGDFKFVVALILIVIVIFIAIMVLKNGFDFFDSQNSCESKKGNCISPDADCERRVSYKCEGEKTCCMEGL